MSGMDGEHVHAVHEHVLMSGMDGERRGRARSGQRG